MKGLKRGIQHQTKVFEALCCMGLIQCFIDSLGGVVVEIEGEQVCSLSANGCPRLKRQLNDAGVFVSLESR